MARKILFALTFLCLLCVAGCGGGSNTTSTTLPASNPVPAVSSISPTSLAVGATPQALTINGTGFLTTSTVTFNGVAHSATYVSASQLTISLTTADLASAGSYPVVVTNAAPGGGSSVAVNFAVTASNPVPTVTSLSPATLTAGATPQTLTINGTGFLSTSTVTFNGVAHTATYVSASQLTISLTTGDLATAGSYPVVVTNPAPGGGPSTAVSFTVSASNPVPTLSSITPLSVLAGSNDTSITIAGTNFTSLSVVNFNSQALATTYGSSSSLTALITSAQLSSAGTATVSVSTPTPGGGTSSGAQFTINPIVVAAKLVILATPAYFGSPSGPWLLSVAAADTNGNPVPNLPITLNSSEGTIAQTLTATGSTGAVTTSITPPDTYSGEAVEVSAVSGSQTAVIDIVFADSSSSGTVNTGTAYTRPSYNDIRNRLALPEDSPGLTSTNPSFNQLTAGTSNGSATGNSLAGIPDVCKSIEGLGSTVSVTCQSYSDFHQLQVTPYSGAASFCKAADTVIEAGSCGGAVGIFAACLFPETGVGAAICTGNLELEGTLTKECLEDLANEIAQLRAHGDPLTAEDASIITIAAVEKEVSATNALDLSCSGIDRANASNLINVTAASESVQLGETVQFTADKPVTWSLVGGTALSGSLGTISSIDSQDALYTAPSVAPSSTYCNVLSEYSGDSCPITIVATGTGSNQADYTSTTILLSSLPSLTVPSIISLAPPSILVGSPAQDLFVNGIGFKDGDKVTFNDADRNTTFITTTQLKVALVAADLASTGSFPVTAEHSFSYLLGGGGFATKNLSVVAAPTPVPPAPSPSSPGTTTDTGATVPSTTPKLVWTGTGAAQYELTISQSPNGTTAVFDSGRLDGGTTFFSVTAGHLMTGVKYRWSIRAHNSAGWSAPSPYLYFTVSAGSLPSTPSPISPGTSSDTSYPVSTTTPTMNWSGSGATTYELAISQAPYGASNPTYDNNQLSGSATSYPIPTGVLHNGVKYCWNMQATNAAGQSDWSTPLYFTVNDGSGGVPAIPTPLTPGGYTSPGTTVTNLTPTLNWSASSGAAATSYTVGVWKVGGGTVLLQSVATAPFVIPTGALQNGAAYYWGVSASNAAGSSVTSSVLYFTVNSTATLSAPTLSNPPNGQSGVSTTPTFGWSQVSGAAQYWLTVATSAAALPTSPTAKTCSGTCVINETPSTNSYPVPTGTLISGQTYYWEVQAFNNSGATDIVGPYSGQWTFTTQASLTTPASPTPLAPGGIPSPGTTVTTLTPTLDWSASTGATSYTAQVWKNNGVLVFSQNVTATTGSTISMLMPAGWLQHGVSYYWGVSASNAAGTSIVASVLYFTVN